MHCYITKEQQWGKIVAQVVSSQTLITAYQIFTDEKINEAVRIRRRQHANCTQDNSSRKQALSWV